MYSTHIHAWTEVFSPNVSRWLTTFPRWMYVIQHNVKCYQRWLNLKLKFHGLRNNNLKQNCTLKLWKKNVNSCHQQWIEFTTNRFWYNKTKNIWCSTTNNTVFLVQKIFVDDFQTSHLTLKIIFFNFLKIQFSNSENKNFNVMFCWFIVAMF